MKILPILSGVFLACHASDITDTSDIADVSLDQIAFFRDICSSFTTLSEEGDKEDAIATLNPSVNWKVLLQIPECRNMISNHFNILFNDNVNLTQLLSHGGENIWNFINYLRIVPLVSTEMELEMSNNLVEFFVENPQNVLAFILTQVDTEISTHCLMEMQRGLGKGKFTEIASLGKYLFFFMTAAKIGLITLESYSNLMESVLEGMDVRNSFKSNFLMEILSFWRHDLLFPEYLITKYRLVLLEKGLDCRKLLTSWKKFNNFLQISDEKFPIELDLTLPKVILDYPCHMYTSWVAIYGPDGYHGPDIQFDTIIEQFSSISEHYLEIAQDGLYEEADAYLEEIKADILHDRFPILENVLKSFKPGSDDSEFYFILQRQQYLKEFEHIQSYKGNRSAITYWLGHRNIWKRFLIWFEEEEGEKCLEFIKEYGNELLIDLKDIILLVEMGPSVWDNLEKFSLIPVIERRLSHFIKYSKECDLTTEMFLEFYKRFLDQFALLLPKLLNSLRWEERVEFYTILADKLCKGNYTKTASIYGYLLFFISAFHKGLISKYSYLALHQSLLSALEYGPALISSYIVVAVGGDPFPVKLEEEGVLENLFDLHRSGIPEKLRIYRPNMDSYIEPVEVELKMPIFFHDENFKRYLLSFVLSGEFKDPIFISMDSDLSSLIIYVIISEFIDICHLEISDSSTCTLGDEFLQSNLYVLQDSDLANTLYKVLWSIIPDNTRPVASRT